VYINPDLLYEIFLNNNYIILLFRKISRNCSFDIFEVCQKLTEYVNSNMSSDLITNGL